MEAIPYVIRDTHGTAISAEQAKAIIAEKWTVAARCALTDAPRRRGKRPRTSQGLSEKYHAT